MNKYIYISQLTKYIVYLILDHSKMGHLYIMLILSMSLELRPTRCPITALESRGTIVSSPLMEKAPGR